MPELPCRGRLLPILAAFAALPCAAAAANAQRSKSAPPEFTRQGLLIVNFAPGPGASVRLGRSAGNAVRSRLSKLVNKREVDIADGNDIEERLLRSGYDPDGVFTTDMIRSVGRVLRADEYVLATVATEGGGVRLSGVLVLLRDERLRQPLPDAIAPKLDSAAQLFAQSVASARTQLAPQRRCENALHERHADRALAAARDGVGIYQRSTIARTCVVWALQQSGAAAADVLATASEVLALDSTSAHAIEASAIALDSLHRRDDAAAMWLRLAATDTASLDLALRVSYALLDGGNARRAEPFITRVSDAHPDDIRLMQQTWRIAFENKSWNTAIAAAEGLLERDSTVRSDSTFYLRLATAYQAAGRPFQAMEAASHGVARFPNDARLYSLYTQYVKAEADTVVARGLTMFPRNADLVALHAKELRAKGKIAESLEATKQAVALDSTLSEGQLTVAQLEIELGRADSALAALHRAVASGEDSALVARFALAKGNALYREASSTKASADFALAFRFLSFADTVRASPQSRFLVGAAALGVAQSALTEAATRKDKTESCRLAKLGAEMIPVARTGLQTGHESFAEAAQQSLEYLDQLDPYAGQAITAYCSKPM